MNSPSSARKTLWILLVVIALTGIALLSGCSNYDRNYSASYDLNTQRGTACVTITPGSGQRSFTGRVTSGIDWHQANRDLPRFYRDK